MIFHPPRPCNKARKGFTLVELLVVIGIIAVLVGILLPVLGKARAAANTVKCLANLRSIGQAMMIYVNEEKGAIPGSALTSGQYFFDFSKAGYPLINTDTTNLPGGSPIEPWDFVTPLAKSMNIRFKTANDKNGLNRWLEQCETQVFRCPSASAIATAFPVNSGPSIVPISYNTAMGFLMGQGNPNPGNTSFTRMSTGTGWWVLPSGYAPKITHVGLATQKIFAADGAKYTYSGSAPEYQMTIDTSMSSASTGNHGKYTDWGAWSLITGSYDQYTSAVGAIDGRLASFRHGKNGQRLPAGNYRMNAVFFDGHAETLDDVEATNPRLWLPRGTVFSDLSKIPAIVKTRFSITTPYRVP